MPTENKTEESFNDDDFSSFIPSEEEGEENGDKGEAGDGEEEEELDLEALLKTGKAKVDPLQDKLDQLLEITLKGKESSKEDKKEKTEEQIKKQFYEGLQLHPDTFSALESEDPKVRQQGWNHFAQSMVKYTHENTMQAVEKVLQTVLEGLDGHLNTKFEEVKKTSMGKKEDSALQKMFFEDMFPELAASEYKDVMDGVAAKVIKKYNGNKAFDQNNPKHVKALLNEIGQTGLQLFKIEREGNRPLKVSKGSNVSTLGNKKEKGDSWDMAKYI